MDTKPMVLRPMQPRRIARLDCEFQCRGTAIAYIGLGLKAGGTLSRPPNRSASQVADYLVEIVVAYQTADTILLEMDNLNSHRCKALVDRYGESIGGLLWDRFMAHYSPKRASWQNQAEIEVSLFSRQRLARSESDCLANCAEKRNRATGKRIATTLPSTGGLHAKAHVRSLVKKRLSEA